MRSLTTAGVILGIPMILGGLPLLLIAGLLRLAAAI